MSDGEIYRNIQHKAAMMRSAQQWADWQVEIVKREWPKEELSAAQIAALTGKSRNAVIGKAHRLGLAGRPICNQMRNPDGEIVPKPKKKRVWNKESNKMRNEKVRAKPKLWGNVLPAKMAGIGLDQLNAFTCRAVVGQGSDGLATYCGGATFSTKPFCEGHCAMYYVVDQRKVYQ